jgi:hypothetical protein
MMESTAKPYRFQENEKPAELENSAGFLKNAFNRGVSAWRIVTQAALSNFVLIPAKL